MTIILAIFGSILLVALSTFTVAVSWAARTVLVVPGTGNPTPDASFVNAEVRNFVTPTNPECGTLCTQVPVDYPASFWPIILFGIDQLHSDKWDVSVQTGVDNLGNELAEQYDPVTNPETDQFYIVGYSQGSTVVSYFKRGYADNSLGDALPPLDQLTFVAAANPNRPNGGLFMRPGIFGPFTIPILDATVGIPAPTDTGVRTTDIVITYDGVSDFPAYPMNLLAVANAIAGLLFIHPTYPTPNSKHPDGHPYGYSVDEFTDRVSAAQQAADAGQCSEAVHCQQFGDTTYITLPTEDLPLLAPVRFLGEQTGLSVVTRPLTDLIEPMLRVLIETGYDRTSYGTPTPFQLLPLNPSKVATLVPDLVAAAVQGVEDALGDIVGSRPAPAPTQDPFATAASLFTDAPASSDSAAPAPTIDAATDNIADGAEADTSSSEEENTTSPEPETETTTPEVAAHTATLDMPDAAEVTPDATSGDTDTPGATDPITGIVSGATEMVGSIIDGATRRTTDTPDDSSETPETSTTQADTSSEAATSEAATSEASTSEATTSEATTSEASTSEAATSEASTSEAATSEASTSEASEASTDQLSRR